MSTNVYLVVTDLHVDYVKENRISYITEILDALADIQTIANAYRQKYKDCKLTLALLGDVFDGSITNASDAMQALEMFRLFCSSFDRVVSVVGNHEITYARDNPFWFLVSSIDDEGLQQVRRYIQPKGLFNVIEVLDTLEDGDVTFYFNHFGVRPKVPVARGVRIGLFHQNVGSNDICKMWGTFDNVEEASYIQGYNYCFFGHMHLAKGQYYLNDSNTCIGEWLGSIGRTKVDEVLDSSLEVNVPAIVIVDGKFQGVDKNLITLASYAECVDKLRAQATKLNRQRIKERNEIAMNSYKGETLYETLKVGFAGTELEFIFSFLSHSWDEVYHTYLDTMSKPDLFAGSDTEEEESYDE